MRKFKYKIAVKFVVHFVNLSVSLNLHCRNRKKGLLGKTVLCILKAAGSLPAAAQRLY